MLYRPSSLSDPILNVIKDDPVRPEIPVDFRISENREVLILMKDEKPQAVVCVAYMDDIPTSCSELFSTSSSPSTVIFYTIWSYAPGAGAKLLQTAAEWLRRDHKDLKGIVTLSPQTAMAERFHLKNGAKIRKTNRDTVNYEYDIK